MDEKKAPRRQSKQDLKNALLASLQRWINEGNTPEQAVERLSIKQYDFLCDQDVDLDNLLLTPEQVEAVKIVKRGARPTFPAGYAKKYPQDKQDLYTALVQFVKEQGGEITEREKQNFRDLDFQIAGKAYKIVLSVPRGKRGE